MNTLLLDDARWDLVLDAGGNIAMAAPPYATAQDAASAIRLFQGEQYYDTAPGVPYFRDILGYFPPLALMKASFVAAALTVPGAVSAACIVTGFKDRQVTGRVEIAAPGGATAAAAF